MVNLYSYLLVSTILFVLGIFTLLARKNIVAILLGVELILNAAALNFVAYSKFATKNLDGQIFALFIIVIAAAEAAVALAIVIRNFQIRETIHIDEYIELRN